MSKDKESSDPALVGSSKFYSSGKPLGSSREVSFDGVSLGQHLEENKTIGRRILSECTDRRRAGNDDSNVVLEVFVDDGSSQKANADIR
jgi:hypothetical protein